MSVEAASTVDSIGAVAAVVVLAGVVEPRSLAFIAALRAQRPGFAQLVLTETDDVEARLAAYAAGADDCLSKPFHLRELVAKLRALGRRSERNAALALLAGSATLIDQPALELKFADRALRLTKREGDLIVLLARAAGAVVRREDVLRDAWRSSEGVSENLVDVYVGYARRKLDDLSADVTIRSVRGEGFRLQHRSKFEP